jgi:hypothetical protein
MPRRDDAPRDLLFGLLALQNGLVSRDQLVLAFALWTGARGRPLADLLAGQGALRPEQGPLLVPARHPPERDAVQPRRDGHAGLRRLVEVHRDRAQEPRTETVNMNTLLMLSAALLAAPAPLQDDDRFEPDPFSEAAALSLLREPAVCKDLKLAPPTAAKVVAAAEAAVVARLRASLGPDGEPPAGPGPPEVNVEVEQAATAVMARALRGAAALLTPAQRKRLGEIRLQSLPLSAIVSDGRLAARLNLSDEQRAAVKAASEAGALAAAAEGRRRLPGGPGPDGSQPPPISSALFASVEADRERIRERADREALKLLTRKQRAKLEAMKGAPFDPKKGAAPQPQPPGNGDRR